MILLGSSFALLLSSSVIDHDLLVLLLLCRLDLLCLDLHLHRFLHYPIVQIQLHSDLQLLPPLSHLVNHKLLHRSLMV